VSRSVRRLRTLNVKYELWHSPNGRTDIYTLLAAGAPRAAALLEPDATVVWTVEAETWDEACRKQHEFLGWDPYKPMTES
jgi:hypothetical protein